MSAAASWPLSTSLSTRFLLHPKVMIFTLSFVFFVFINVCKDKQYKTILARVVSLPIVPVGNEMHTA